MCCILNTPNLVRQLQLNITQSYYQQSLLKQMSFLLIISILTMSTYQIIFPCQRLNEQHGNNKLKLSQRQILTDTLYNFSMIVDDKDNTISRIIKESGTWKSELIRAMSYFIKEKFKVLNVGAQTGLEAIIMGNIIGPEGKLYIMEPYSVSYSIVKKNIYLNSLQKITRVFRVGASDIQTKGHIFVESQNTGGAQVHLKSIPQNNKDRNLTTQEVYLDLIDNILDGETIKIDFVLMDVQNMQVQALLGMKKLIQRSPNIILMVQWQYMANSHRNQAKALRLLDWLQQKDFKVYRYIQDMSDSCKIGAFKQFDIKSLMTLEVTDIFIVPKHIDPNNYH